MPLLCTLIKLSILMYLHRICMTVGVIVYMFVWLWTTSFCFVYLPLCWWNIQTEKSPMSLTSAMHKLYHSHSMFLYINSQIQRQMTKRRWLCQCQFHNITVAPLITSATTTSTRIATTTNNNNDNNNNKCGGRETERNSGNKRQQASK